MSFWDALEQNIRAKLGPSSSMSSHRQHGHGCLGPTYIANVGSLSLFIKTGERAYLGAFEAERDGLIELATANAVRIPRVVDSGLAADRSYLVMEYLDLRGDRSAAAERLGRALALQHRFRAKQFGWRRDNTIGATRQANSPSADWVEFLGRQRLQPQLALAERNGLDRVTLDLGLELVGSLGFFFSGYAPPPSLLHGDLWSGNYGVTETGEPVVFDPAVYYGDRECDIAMTALFGGFPARFYAAYENVWALDSGFATRKTLYNLYHVLNHFNLFGAPYGAQAHDMLTRLLSELR